MRKGPDEILAWAQDVLLELMAEIGRAPSDVLAIGVGLPGPIEFAAGRTVDPPVMPGWNGISLSEGFPAFEAPVVVDNDANVAALGEYWTNWRHQVDDLLYAKLGTGIGCGIILGGVLQRGALGASGELGHIGVSTDDPPLRCRCGNLSCLETVASGRVLAEQLSATGGRSVANCREFVEVVRRGDPDAIQLVRGAGRAVGEALATAVNLLNPSVIVVGGDLAGAEEQLLAGIREVVYQRSTALATRTLQIVQSTLGDRCGIVGASVSAVGVVLAPEVVDRDLGVREEIPA